MQTPGLLLRAARRLPSPRNRALLATAAIGSGALLTCNDPCRIAVLAEGLQQAKRNLSAVLSAEVSEQDRAILGAAFTRHIEQMQARLLEPEAMWTSKSSKRVAGLEEVTIREGRLENCPAPLFVGTAVYPDVTTEELLAATDGAPGGKERFDPTIRGVEVLTSFPNPNGPVALFRTRTWPMLLGLISSRETDDWGQLRDLGEGRTVRFGFGNGTAMMRSLLKPSLSLEVIMGAASGPGEVRCLTHTSGFLVEPLDDAARSGGRGRCRLSYWVACEAGGSIPVWASQEGCKRAVVDYFRLSLKDILSQRLKAQA